MITEDTLREALHEQAASTGPLHGLAGIAMARGRRRRRVRRAAVACGGVAFTVAAVVGGVAVADSLRTHAPISSGFEAPPVASPSPWWETWPAGRHFGPVDGTFLDAVGSPYGGNITVYASGVAADGTDFALYLDHADGHNPQWIQGWNGVPDFGEPGDAVPATTWMTFSSPSAAAQNSTNASTLQQWLIVVGRPGTTEIDYSPDGVTWTPMPEQHGIGMLLIPDGYPPASAKVRLADASGVYATGVPAGAGADRPSAGPASSSTGHPDARLPAPRQSGA